MRIRTAVLIATPIVLVAGAVIGLSTLDDTEVGTVTTSPELDKHCTDTRLADASAACIGKSTTPKGGITVEDADNGQTLLIDTNPLEGYNGQYGSSSTDDDVDGLVCVLDQL